MFAFSTGFGTKIWELKNLLLKTHISLSYFSKIKVFLCQFSNYRKLISENYWRYPIMKVFATSHNLFSFSDIFPIVFDGISNALKILDVRRFLAKTQHVLEQFAEISLKVVSPKLLSYFFTFQWVIASRIFWNYKLNFSIRFLTDLWVVLAVYPQDNSFLPRCGPEKLNPGWRCSVQNPTALSISSRTWSAFHGCFMRSLHRAFDWAALSFAFL